jgi:putative thiamine transport system permease protein
MPTPRRQAQGAAAAWLLALACWLVVALVLGVLRAAGGGAAAGPTGTAGTGARPRRADGRPAGAAWCSLAACTAVMLALAVGSVSGVWPFPALLAPDPDRRGLALGGQSAARWAPRCRWPWPAGGRAGVVGGLAGDAHRWDAWLRRWSTCRWSCRRCCGWWGARDRAALGIDGPWSGLWLAHTLACVPYVLIALSPAYTGFDPRYRQVSASLGHGRLRFLLRVKWPLLRAALWSALAVGFAVSVAQYLPTLFIGAGRFATVTTEAVTLASGAAALADLGLCLAAVAAAGPGFGWRHGPANHGAS